MQIYQVKQFNRGHSGFSDEDLAYRLGEIELTREATKMTYDEFMSKHPAKLMKTDKLTQTEWENIQKVNKYVSGNPRTGAKTDDKFKLQQEEYQRALKQDQEAREELAKIAKAKVANELRSMNLIPEEYTYSKEYQREVNS